jgi:cation transport regulator ChaC
MTKTDLAELDETLKLLNGLHDNLSKRIQICKYVEDNGIIPVFAYASLLWNPIEYVDQMIVDCTLYGYRKGFICEDFIYRGTMNFTGLTMGLQEDPHSNVNGVLLISNANQVIPFLKAFVERETPTSINGTKMDIYQYDLVKIIMADGISSQYALTCVVNTNSLFYLNPQLTLEEQAQKMARAYGQNGTNLQYLQRAIQMYHKFNLNDSCTAEIEDLYDKIILCRQSLSINDQKWLEIYDELQTLEERQKIVATQTLVAFQTNIEPYLHRSICLQELCSQF